MRGTQLWKHRTGVGARNDDMDKYLIKNFITSVGAAPCACPCSEGSHRGLPLQYVTKFMCRCLTHVNC
ncbi:hypothetical protein [Desulfonema limicola]|uniref:hypothetical protein n=1 Tax=Desulfonema limicola TaxID=45656 RepID=UPI001A9AC7C9|nr:hypothetical protein [Desulfonema limicola]